MNKTLKLKGIFKILAVLLIFRLFISIIVLFFLNLYLKNSLDNYSGHIKDINFSLIQGSYSIVGLEIKKRNFQGNSSFLFIDTIKMDLDYSTIFNSDLRIKLFIISPELNLRDSDNKKNEQLGKNEEQDNWKKTFKTLIPIEIDQLEIVKGIITFNNLDLDESPPLKMTHLSLFIENLNPTKNKQNKINSSALLMNKSPLTIDGLINFKENGSYSWFLDYELEGFPLTKTNKLLLKYVPLDFTKGTLDIKGHHTQKDNSRGEIKFYFNNATVLDKTQEIKNASHLAIELSSALLNFLLQNSTTKSFAFSLPYHKTKNALRFDYSNAIWSSIKNNNTPLPKI